MAEKLGIFVSSDKNLRHVIEITKAAEAAGKEVILFFTHKGVFLTQDPEFKELMGLGKKSLSMASSGAVIHRSMSQCSRARAFLSKRK